MQWAFERKKLLERWEREEKEEERQKELARAKAEEDYRTSKERPLVTFKVP